MNKTKNKSSKVIESLIIIVLLLSPIAVFIYYLDSIESSDLFGLAVVAIPVMLVVAYMLYHNSWRANSPRKAMEELEDHQKKV